MITDDPGTLETANGKNNLAIAFEHRPGETDTRSQHRSELRIWVNSFSSRLQTAPVLLKRSGSRVTAIRRNRSGG